MDINETMKSIMNPPKAKSIVEPIDKNLPRLEKKDFDVLNDSSVKSYINSVPQNEWLPILKTLLIGASGAIGSILVMNLGRFIEWMKMRQSGGRIGDADSWAGRIGTVVGKGVKTVLEGPEQAGKFVKRLGKSVSVGLGTVSHLMKTQPAPSILQRVGKMVDSFRKFKKEKD